jgi:Uncharacterized protein conserved in bacteria (DUF2252)
MKIGESTRSYENWMRQCAPVVESHLRDKHSRMKEDPFQFVRATYYRWAQVWPEVCGECAVAPTLLSVGDLHVDSFGTWRDIEGRLCWGVDDFDESYRLPYTNDLVRLATSARIARKMGILSVKNRLASEIILDAYVKTLSVGGRPFVLAEGARTLEKLGIEALKTPKDFWEKLCAHPAVSGSVPKDALRSLEAVFPDQDLDYRVISREAGLGSLGQQRFVAIADCRGGFIAREAKRLLPSASIWLRNRVASCQSHYQTAMTSAVRSPDPYQTVKGSWLIRRLSPDSNPIKMEELSAKREEETLLSAMGTEIANVHLGDPAKTKQILRDLKKRDRDWLLLAAKKMAKFIIRDWTEYRN